MNFVIRSARENDFESILKLMRDFALEDGLNPATVNFNESSFLKYGFGSEKCFCCDLGLVDGKTISYTMYSIRYSGVTGTPVLYLEDIYISINHRNRGFGKSLMNHTMGVADSRNCARMEWVVDKGNTSAKEFYKNIDAHIMDDLRICRLQVEPNRDGSVAG